MTACISVERASSQRQPGQAQTASLQLAAPPRPAPPRPATVPTQLLRKEEGEQRSSAVLAPNGMLAGVTEC